MRPIAHCPTCLTEYVSAPANHTTRDCLAAVERMREAADARLVDLLATEQRLRGQLAREQEARA